MVLGQDWSYVLLRAEVSIARCYVANSEENTAFLEGLIGVKSTIWFICEYLDFVMFCFRYSRHIPLSGEGRGILKMDSMNA